MANSSLGTLFRITTFGESHGKAIGVVIDGCPAGLSLSDEDINEELALRMPGKTPFTSPRKESDRGEILSGIFEGKTTGAPIAILIWNHDADSSKYEPIKNLLRPGHANYTYLEKYGIFDWRGGGRSSARETACRVAAGAVAKKLLAHYHIDVVAYLSSVADTKAAVPVQDPKTLRKKVRKSAIFCPDEEVSKRMEEKILIAKEEQDSLGGVIEFQVANMPIGLGDPVYEKLEANLAKALMSLPATKGFEVGSGFSATEMKGSQHNDDFILEKGEIRTKTNFAGGTLGGISNGMPLIARLAFKPTSSIFKEQKTVDYETKKEVPFKLPAGSRHDPCVTIRAVPIVEAMVALVLADALLMNRASKL